jgi:DNA-binding response OmpR family regulator
MNHTNVLVVEDEQIVAMEIKSYVEHLGYAVAGICTNSSDALKIVANEDVSIVLMDIHIEGNTDGIETAEQIKKKYPDTQIIFLTAHMDDYNVDRAVVLDPVAYLSKPFRREELRAFMKIAVKKSTVDHKIVHEVVAGSIALDEEFSYHVGDRQLIHCGEVIYLTKKEAEMLDVLVLNKNMIVDLYTIENQIWPNKSASANTIRTLIKRLREKLNYRFIETIPMSGYRLILSS